MIVYRDARRVAHPVEQLAAVRALASRVAAVVDDHDGVRDLLIETGALESMVADARNAECDGLDDAASELCAATDLAARALALSWRGAARSARRQGVAQVQAALAAIAPEALPAAASADVLEGYAYYALYPEGHLVAGREVGRRLRPERAWCIGIRSIGTSLAAAAAAGLEAGGCAVRRLTVRPHGHPFDRVLRLAPSLAARLRAERDALFVVADEGPGLSGSTFGAVARALTELGVPDHRIVLLPAWTPDGTAFISDAARRQWQRHQKIVVPFETLWLRSHRLVRAHGDRDATLADLSAGAWRRAWVRDGREFPAVQPQHERRKYLIVSGAGAGGGARAARLLKFAGFGARGAAVRERGARLHAAGLAPEPLAVAAGFVAWQVVAGRPLTVHDVNAGLLERVARYLAFVRREFEAREPCPWDALMELVDVNVGEVLGRDGASTVARLAPYRPACTDAPVVALDGRMLPHEWVRAWGADAGDVIKTDATDHHADHFFPGHQDIAWDLAATCTEFALSTAERAFLLERYRVLSGDTCVTHRMPVYHVAYLAHRVAYAATAVRALAGSHDARRWRVLADRYTASLQRAVARASHAA